MSLPEVAFVENLDTEIAFSTVQFTGMRSKTLREAVVTIQGGRIPRLDFYGKPDPYVRLYITTPKGKSTVTVPTSCRTSILKNEVNPIWNESFAVPVLPDKEILVFKVFDSRERLQDGFVGLCMLPVSKFAEKEVTWVGRLELFNPAKATPEATPEIGGTLDIAAKLVSTDIMLLEKEDLISNERHKSQRKPFASRFLGVGELAAFYLDEGFSDDVDANWDQAVRILSEQLAYRIWEETGCIDDTKNYNEARAKVLEEGGLWDGH